MITNPPTWERIAIFGFGIAFISILVTIAIFLPDPSDFQYTIFRIVLALAAAGIAALIPGFLELKYKTALRAGGALAVFVIVFFLSPAAIVTGDYRNPTDPFRIIVINQKDSQYISSTFDFQISDIDKMRHSNDFIILLKQLPGQDGNIDVSTIFRVSDQAVITHRDGDVLAGRNKCALVVPNSLINQFENNHLAFVYIRSQLPYDARCL